MLRAITRVKRIFRTVESMKREDMVEHLGLVMGCDAGGAVVVLDDLVVSGYVTVRGHGRAAMVYPGMNIDTNALGAMGIRVPQPT